jgi:uncharacterized membrane protein YkoI
VRALGLVLPVALALAAGATGADDIDQDEALALRRSGALQPLESLLARVRERHPGATLLEAELERKHERLIYELEVLGADGQVRELEFDARSGELLQDEEED